MKNESVNKQVKNRNNIKRWNFWVVLLCDILASILSTVFAFFGTQCTFSWFIGFWALGNIILLLVVFAIFRLYSLMFKTVGVVDMVKIVVSSLIILLCNTLYGFFTQSIRFSTALVYALSLGVLCGFVRYFERFTTAARYYFAMDKKTFTRVMIVGGGDAGHSIIKEMIESDKSVYKPVVIADDDPEKRGKHLYNVKIAGTTFDVAKLVKDYSVDEIFLTIPSANKRTMSEIVKRCQECNKPVKILPSMYQLATGEVTVAKMRPVEVKDLLGREQVSVNLDEIMEYLENKTVLVTGGGGSIGSELCRQIATHKPKTLIVLDIYENSAYEIEQELKRKYPDMHLLTLIASVRDSKKIRSVFERYRPQIVFHAAAHKHVPLMETSPNEAVKNNVYGTWNVAKYADEFEAETFVQISTDKAVNPTNIMGATKRICEMIVQTIGKHSKNTKFVAVRFGNVLGSNGSVIPLFRQQIAEGGPVTVTHKDIIRYFMTIPEAVSLVLQAGAYAKGGQIFVLDMGEPVRIYDLAFNLIRLSGYKPNVDIDIVCTGLRPGEKLYEERLMEEEGLKKTPNGLINIAKPIPLDERKFWVTLEKLCDEAYEETEHMKTFVKELVPTYTIDGRDSVAEALGTVQDVTGEKKHAKQKRKKA